MIHILHSSGKKKQFYFVEVSSQNGKVLATSEMHTTKNAVVVNIIASMKVFNSVRTTIIDHTKRSISLAADPTILVYDLVRTIQASKVKYEKVNEYWEKMSNTWKKLEHGWSTRVRLHKRS